MSLKRLLALFFLMALAVQLVPAGATQSQPSLTVGVLDPIPLLDPAGSASFFAWDVLSYLSTGLARQVPGAVDYELALAATHEVSADGLEHRFSLRPDAAFSDGTPITAAIAARSIDRTLRLDSAAAVFTEYAQGLQARADGDTLVITLAAPTPYLLGLLALPPFHPLHPRVFAEDHISAEVEPEAYIGSGPYRPESSSLDELALVADPGWKGEPPTTPRIVIRRHPAPAALRDALIAGEVDITWQQLPADYMETALQSGQRIREVRTAGIMAFYLVYGLRHKPFDMIEARRALLPFFDRELATRTALHGRAETMVSLLPPALAGARDPSYPSFDADAGAAALRDNGFSRFRRIEGAWQTARATYGDEYLAAVEALTRTLSRNPAVRIARVDSEPDTFFDQFQRGTAPAQFVGLASLVPHPDAYLTPLLSSTGAIAQAAGYSNPDVDRLLREAALASPDEARALYAEVQAIALQDIVVVPLWGTGFGVLARESVDAESIVLSPNFRLHLDLLRRAG